MNNRLHIFLEDRLRLDNILYAFWAVFWVLNGLDKFFNGVPRKHPTYGNYVEGWFGTNRDDKFIHYFSRLHLPEELALGSLYTFGVAEVLLGGVFLWILATRAAPGMVHRLAFKGNMLLFFVFSTGDILFGDRMELWEHGTFMILTLMTYQLYLDRSNEYRDVVGPAALAGADLDRDNEISSEEFDAFIERLRKACTPDPSGR